ncbi:LapA family protein [Pedobacter arcticus]|uniref:hypothetical protein n=1 Tax=Pedobacter arcticus TaxID=752140 RepID=UPI000374CDB6|nr:hypothetical protein [Pedobacter arcticus]
MSFKTYSIIFLSVAITIIFMQNLDPVQFKVLWMEFTVAKLVMMLVVTVFGFILGLIVARPRKKKLAESAVNSIPFEINQPENAGYLDTGAKSSLSEEDKDYIS